MNEPTPVEMRRGVLAVSVLHDVDIEPGQLGVTLTTAPAVEISWDECRRALAGTDPETPDGRTRLARWLLARRWAADISVEALRERLRPVGLPVGHALHPGADWVRRRVRGGALDLGFGAVDIDPNDPDHVVLLPQPLLEDRGIDAGVEWLMAEAYLERMGALSSERIKLDRRGQIKPIGDCDVATLLGSATLRRSLAIDAGGMGAVVVPMRRRGWSRLALIDPAFGPAAAAATIEDERGFVRPLLVTAEELALAAEGGRPEVIALSEPSSDANWLRDVLYR